MCLSIYLFVRESLLMNLFVHMYVCVRACILCKCVCIFVYISLSVCVCLVVFVCNNYVSLYMFMCTRTCVYVCVYVRYLCIGFVYFKEKTASGKTEEKNLCKIRKGKTHRGKK